MNWWNTLKVDSDFEMGNEPGTLGYFNTDGNYENPIIRVHPNEVYTQLKRLKGREPTEQEIQDWIDEVLRHESGHASHHNIDVEDWKNRTSEEREDFAGKFETHKPGRPIFGGKSR